MRVLGFRDWEFRVSGFRDSDFFVWGLGIEFLGFRALGLGFSGFGFGGEGSGFRGAISQGFIFFEGNIAVLYVFYKGFCWAILFN